MTWIESHASLGAHTKTYRLCDELDLSDVTAVGHLHFLWWWSVDNADADGVLPAMTTAGMIARAAHWSGPHSADGFVHALVVAGFLELVDERYRIHDWDDYAGRLLDQREKNRLRMREARAARRVKLDAMHVQDTSGARVPHDPNTSGARARATGPDLNGASITETSSPSPVSGRDKDLNQALEVSESELRSRTPTRAREAEPAPFVKATLRALRFCEPCGRNLSIAAYEAHLPCDPGVRPEAPPPEANTRELLSYRLAPISEELHDDQTASSVTRALTVMQGLGLEWHEMDNACKEALRATHARLRDTGKSRVELPMAYFLGALEQRAAARAAMRLASA